MSDQLAKWFSHHLSEAVGNDDGARRLLRMAGWYDFINMERPTTDDPVVMATEAFIYIGFEDGGWFNCNALILAVISFLKEQKNVDPSQEQLAGLGRLIFSNPIDIDGVRAWFTAVYA